jgi:hypothetical protein
VINIKVPDVYRGVTEIDWQLSLVSFRGSEKTQEREVVAPIHGIPDSEPIQKLRRTPPCAKRMVERSSMHVRALRCTARGIPRDAIRSNA